MFVPTKTILWMPNAFYKPNTPAIPINSQRLHKFCEWRLCRGDPEIHRQIPTMHFGDPLEEDLNPRKKTFDHRWPTNTNLLDRPILEPCDSKMKKLTLLRCLKISKKQKIRYLLLIFWDPNLSACKQLMEWMTHQHRYQCCNSPPWSLPWT